MVRINKYIIIFLACCLSSCIELKYLYPVKTHYYMEDIDVHIIRYTDNYKSEFIIKRDSVLVGELVWRYDERNEYRQLTDSGTENILNCHRDTIYADGQGWHVKKQSSEFPIIIVKDNIPNHYYEICPPLRPYPYRTEYYQKMVDSLYSVGIGFNMYPDLESKEFPRMGSDTLHHIRRCDCFGCDFGWYQGSKR